MTHETERKQVTLDDAVAAVRDDAAPAGAAESAAARVWERIAPRSADLASAQTIRGCHDVRGLLDAHRKNALPPARALLVDDHLRDCPRCRAALAGERRLSLLPWRPGATTETAPPPRRVPRYAVAASVLLVAGLSLWALRHEVAPAGSRAAVQSVTGALQLVAAQRTVALAPGQEVGEAEAVRTARDSRAVLRLRDGSLVEMSERAEIAVTAKGADTTIHLARGSIIVRAARRRTGHLRVASGDCNVEVTGTVFSVNRGLKGSRVSVIEGQVRVAGGGGEAVLAPGEQWATSAAVGRVPVQSEIAWSGEADRYLALLGELNVLGERWRQVRRPELRYESRLLRLLPEETVVFASLPNYGEALGDAHRLFDERLHESAVLRGLWAEADPARHGGPSLDGVIEKVRAVADHLGDEVVLAVVDDRAGHRVVPLVLAEVRRPGLRELLESTLADAGAAKEPAVRIVGESLANTAGRADVFVLLRSDLMVMGVDEPALRALSVRIEAGAGGLDGTPFGERIAQAYGEGAGLLFAADLERITRARTTGEAQEALHRSGLDGLRSFILERKDVADKAHTQAVLSFLGAPRGIPSWLAAPAPMGALDFVSPTAQAVTAFVVKSPALIFDDVVEMASSGDGAARKHLQELESKLDVRLRADIAETLGGEVALALDGPLLPTPAWRLIVEVYDASRLQSSLQTLVNRVSDEPAAADRAALRLEAEQVDADTYYALRGGDLPFELHYVYAGGYLVAGPSRALVMKAVQVRASGESLGRSAAFRGLFPPDRDVNVSGLAYQNLGRMMGSLLSAPGAGGLSAEQRRSFDGLVRATRPTLVSAYGEDGAIRVAGEGPLFDLDAANLALPMLLERVLQSVRPAKP